MIISLVAISWEGGELNGGSLFEDTVVEVMMGSWGMSGGEGGRSSDFF